MLLLLCFYFIFLGREAGDVYLKAGETEIKSGEADGSARKFLNAATCYKRIEPECKIFLFKKIVLNYLLSGYKLFN